jgi:hypothetical protein
MFQNLLGSITNSIPLLSGGATASASANASAPASQPKGGGGLFGLGGLVDAFVSPIAKVAATASKAVDSFVEPVLNTAEALLPGPIGQAVKKVADTLDGADPGPGGGIASGLKVEVNVLKGVVSAQNMDATSKAHIQSALDEVKSGKGLDSSLSSLSGNEKKLLADTIGNAGFEPPECLKSYLTNQSQGDSSRMDCALKNVEVAEEKGYQATEASSMMRFLPLAPALLGG